MDGEVFILCQCINYVDRVDKNTLIICNCQHFLWNKWKHLCHSVVSYFDKGGLNLIFNAHAFVLKKGSVYNCVLRGIYILHNFLGHLILIFSFYLRFIWREESSKLSSLILLNLLPSLTSKRLLLPPWTWTWAPPGKDYWVLFEFSSS